MLVARSKGRLKELAEELPGHSGPAEVLVADLTNSGDLNRVAERIRSAPDLDLLVNNAGSGRTGPFADDELDLQLAQIHLNVTALVHLSHVAVNVMRRAGGTIVNVSSVAGYSPVPNTGVYGATKSFVSSFSQALHDEERDNGVIVTAVAPGFTRTDFQKEAQFDTTSIPDFLWQSAEDVANAALEGAAKKKAMVIPGAHNKAMVGSIKGLPTSVQRRIAGLF